MTVSMSVAPGLAVTQQMAMETDIIIKTVFRMAASLQPENMYQDVKKLQFAHYHKNKCSLRILLGTLLTLTKIDPTQEK